MRLAAFLLALLALAAPIQAQTLAPPLGMVIVTVTGGVANTNRGPFDESTDGLFKNHGVTFDKAAAFDLALLEGLGMRTVRAEFPKGDTPGTFEGPLMSDVLKAAGASGTTIRVQALDQYVKEIPLKELTDYPVILALKRNGRYLGLGGFGPAWIVYPRLEVPALKDNTDDHWVWAVVWMDVR